MLRIKWLNINVRQIAVCQTAAQFSGERMTTTDRADVFALRQRSRDRAALVYTFRRSVIKNRAVFSLPFRSFHHGPSNKTCFVARQHGPVVVLVRHGEGGGR